MGVGYTFWKERRKQELYDAMQEANRFLAKAELAFDELCSSNFNSYYSPKQAAMKRASMDLTKALVVLRKPFAREEDNIYSRL